MLMAAQRLPRTWTEAYSCCCPSTSTSNGGGRYDCHRAAAAEFRDCHSISFEVGNCSGVRNWSSRLRESELPLSETKRPALVLPDPKKRLIPSLDLALPPAKDERPVRSVRLAETALYFGD